eukprot:6214728-Pleurochrysis_carterae.AAC.2
MRLTQRICDRSESSGGPRVHLNVASERKQVEVERPVLGHERAEERGEIGRHFETLRVHTKPCTEGVDLLKVATAARISHEVGRAKDMAHVELPFGGEKSRHGMQVLKRALRRIILCSVVRKVECRRERVRLENNSREMAEAKS